MLSDRSVHVFDETFIESLRDGGWDWIFSDMNLDLGQPRTIVWVVEQLRPRSILSENNFSKMILNNKFPKSDNFWYLQVFS